MLIDVNAMLIDVNAILIAVNAMLNNVNTIFNNVNVNSSFYIVTRRYEVEDKKMFHKNVLPPGPTDRG